MAPARRLISAPAPALPAYGKSAAATTRPMMSARGLTNPTWPPGASGAMWESSSARSLNCSFSAAPTDLDTRTEYAMIVTETRQFRILHVAEILIGGVGNYLNNILPPQLERY